MALLALSNRSEHQRPRNRSQPPSIFIYKTLKTKAPLPKPPKPILYNAPTKASLPKRS